MTTSKLRPHPVLPAYYEREESRASFVRQLFDRSAPHYDRLNQVFSLGRGARHRRECLLRGGLRPGAHVADIAIGTGLLAEEAVAIVGETGLVVGLDLSAGMLAVARAKLRIPLVQGTADALPFATASVDFVTMGYALRHVADLTATFREFHRILRPGGRVLLLEIARPTTPVVRAILSGYLGRVVPLLSRWITGGGPAGTLMQYYWDTIENCVPADVILDALHAAGFTDTGCETALEVFRTYTGCKAPA